MNPALAPSLLARSHRTRTLLLPIAVLLLLAGGLRLLVAEQTRPVRLRGDEVYYLGVAREIAAGHGHARPSPRFEQARRPPAFPWLLSLFVDASGAEESGSDGDPQRLGEELLSIPILLGTALVVLTFLLGRALFDHRVGFLAGLIAAFDPTLVAYSHYFWSETFFTVLVTGALIGVVLGRRSGSWLATIAAGLLFGAAALTREVALPIAAACAAWLVATTEPGARRAAAARGVAIVALAGAVVLPWTWRNYTVFHRLVPVSTIGWFASAEGNLFASEDWFCGEPDVMEFRAAYRAAGDEMQRMDFAHGYALDRIRAEQPAWFFKKLARNTAQLLSPDSYLLLKLREGLYGPVALGAVRWLMVLTVLSFVVVFLLGVIGVASAADPGRRALPLLVFGVVIAIHVLSNSVSRFRVPWMPLLMVYASCAALDLPGSLRRMTWRSWAVAGAILLYFLAVCVPYPREILGQTWRGEVQPPGIEAGGG